MLIQEKVTENIKIAMRNKDTKKMSVLRLLKGEFERINKVISDEKAVSILKKLYEGAIINKDEEEASIINEYLPKILNEGETRIEIENIINSNGYSSMKDIGPIMKQIKRDYGTSMDGKIASKIVKEILS